MIIIPASRPSVFQSIAAIASSWPIVPVIRTTAIAARATLVRSTRSLAITASATANATTANAPRLPLLGQEDLGDGDVGDVPLDRDVLRVHVPADRLGAALVALLERLVEAAAHEARVLELPQVAGEDGAEELAL